MCYAEPVSCPYLAGASLRGAGLGLTLNPQYYSNSVGITAGGGVNDDWLVHKSVEVNKHLVKASPYLAGASLLGAGLGLTLNPQYYSNSVGITAGGGGK